MTRFLVVSPPAWQRPAAGRNVAPKPKAGSLEEKIAGLNALQNRATEEQRAQFRYRHDVSWIHHDSALEGVVYEPTELIAAIDDNVVSDSALLPAYDEIRNFKSTIDLVRKLAAEKELVVTLDTARAIFDALVPDENEKGTRYRKEMPLHRQYFHNLEQPDKISHRMRQLMQWIADDNTTRTMHRTRVAAKAHYEFLKIFPYAKHSGKVARLLMNLMLIHGGYPPVILHATDRQRYYESLRGSSDDSAEVILDALNNSIASAVKYYLRLFGELDDD